MWVIMRPSNVIYATRSLNKTWQVDIPLFKSHVDTVQQRALEKINKATKTENTFALNEFKYSMNPVKN